SVRRRVVHLLYGLPRRIGAAEAGPPLSDAVLLDGLDRGGRGWCVRGADRAERVLGLLRVPAGAGILRGSDRLGGKSRSAEGTSLGRRVDLRGWTHRIHRL